MTHTVSIHQPIRMKALILFFLLTGFTGLSTYAATYYTVANGAWSGAIWRLGSTTGAGSVLPALFAGDVIVIDDQVTISSGTLTIAPSVTINITTTSATAAKLIFTSGGKLALTSVSSVINMSRTSNAFPLPVIDGTGSGGSNTIDIGSGNEVWRTSDTAPTGDITGIGQLNFNSNNGVLPIELIFFNAFQNQNSIDLKWATASERNFDKFIIQRSTDGLTFEAVAETIGAGNSKTKLNYAFNDENPLIGKCYYRLKSVDFDRSFEYSKVVFVEFTGSKSLTVYPSPGNGESITLSTNFDPQANTNIMVMDFAGSEVATASIQNATAEIIFNTKLKSGTYFIKYVSSGYNKVERFVVE